MSYLSKSDIEQIDAKNLTNWEKDALISLIIKLIQLALSLFNRLERNSRNSSNPPSSDSPFDRGEKKEKEAEAKSSEYEKASEKNEPQGQKFPDEKESSSDEPKRGPGKQPGAKGFWRKEKPRPEKTEAHLPSHCAIVTIHSLPGFGSGIKHSDANRWN